MNGLHPSVRILSLLALAVVVQCMQWTQLALASLALGMALLHAGAGVFGNLLRRTRWLLAFLLLIYAFTTPGEYLRGFQSDILPTYEGIAAGLLQVARLVLVLAGLALLLATTPREGLMAGAYLLLRPLRWCGLSPERFAARLWLTLHYVEQMPLPRQQRLRHLLENFRMLPEQSAQDRENIVIRLPRFGWGDALALAALLGFVGVLLL